MNLLLRHFHHFAVIAHDKESSDRLALATFAADIAGQIDDDSQCLQWHFCFESLQIAGCQLGQLLGQSDNADRIAAFFFVGRIDNDNDISGLQQFVSDGFEQNLRNLKMASLWFLLNLDDIDVVIPSSVLDVLPVRRDNQPKISRISLEHGEINRLFREQNHSGRLDVFRKTGRGFEDFFELRTDFVSRHDRSVRRNLNRSTDEIYAFFDVRLNEARIQINSATMNVSWKSQNSRNFAPLLCAICLCSYNTAHLNHRVFTPCDLLKEKYVP